METTRLDSSIRSFVSWLDSYGDLSQDQYDFWANPSGQRAKRLAYHHRVAGLALAAPFVLLDAAIPRSRRVFRGRQRFPIADAHYAMGFFNLAAASPAGQGGAPGPTAAPRGAASTPAAPDSRESRIATGRRYLAALLASRVPGHANAGWGYPFAWEGWFGTFPAGTPFITTTAYVYEAFEQGYGLTGDPEYLEMMRSIARFAHEDLVDQEVAPGVWASSYGPLDRRRVVNASAYRALLLTRAGLRFQREDWLEAARGNIAFVLQSQRPDGSWLYAEEERDRFVDNFHTCFVLKNLVKIAQATGGNPAIGGAAARTSVGAPPAGTGPLAGAAAPGSALPASAAAPDAPGSPILDAAREGYAFYKRNLLDDRGLPVPFAQTQRLNLVRRELYDLAEGINLALLMRGSDPEADSIAGRLLGELLENWTLPDGHFVSRITWFGHNTVPYHRWAQAQTFHALTRAVPEGV